MIVRPRQTLAYTPGLSADVVAGLLNDGQADAVAEAAVNEAIARGARLRFVQVVDEGLSPQQRTEADRATFRSAVRALQGVRGIPCRFEVVTGDPTDTLLELSHSAAAIILGVDGAERPVAAFLCAHATCPVVTVGAHSAA